MTTIQFYLRTYVFCASLIYSNSLPDLHKEILKFESCYCTAQNTNLETPLHKAVKILRYPVVENLVKQGANLNAKDENGDTPLHIALRHHARSLRLQAEKKTGFEKFTAAAATCALLLVVHGADLTIKNNEGQTPLFCGWSRNSFHRILEQTAARDRLLNAQTNDLDTAIHLAAENLSYDIVEYLADVGANLNLKNKDGNTPLHIALRHYARSSSLQRATVAGSCALTLAAHGGDLTIKNNEGQTPLDLCIIPKILVRDKDKLIMPE